MLRPDGGNLVFPKTERMNQNQNYWVFIDNIQGS